MLRKMIPALTVLTALLLALPARAADRKTEALLQKIDLKKGICVFLGEDATETALDVAKSSELTVYLQLPTDENVHAARKRADAAGVLGSRFYVEKGTPSLIGIAANLVDVVVSTDGKGDTTEIMRVLHPRGRLITSDNVITKKVPGGEGEWSHPYHGPDNNPLSKDKLIKGPHVTKFLATPYYGPMPEVSVVSGGRMFKAFGHIAFKEREWAMLGKLICLNSYNGTKLWQRDLVPGFMIHRNTMIATPEVLYLADNKSCKIIDAATGEVKDEIVIGKDVAEGPGWKWMALKDGILYALVGEEDLIDTVLKGTKKTAGWPWTGLGKAYANKEYPWGFGRTLLAMDVKTKKILWKRNEKELIDSRALCMKSGKLYCYSHPNYLMAINAKDGKDVWKTSDEKIMKAIGEHDFAQTWRKGYSSQTYAKASDNVIYFAGPQRTKVVAVDAKTGKHLWDRKDGNYQLIIRDDAIYAMGKTSKSFKLHPRTGEVLAQLDCLRGNCTRATATHDTIFARGDQHGGTLRLAVKDDKPYRIPAMRPACQDGVVVANGQLFWGPWMCDCNHSLVGVISLTSAGKLDLMKKATNDKRLESGLAMKAEKSSDLDWPTYRANNTRTANVPFSIPENVKVQWQFQAKGKSNFTAPIKADGKVFVGGSDGAVRAFDAKSGKVIWTAYTGGAIQYPPTVSEGGIYVGSGDGWIYCFNQKTGQRHWRFRAAPYERKMPVYGKLLSTWPVNTGVLVKDGVAYAAAGIASHDGTFVYALDAKTGKLKWQNNSSSRLMNEEIVAGVSVQGHLLLDKGKLYMAGGNVVSPGIYDAKTGRCLNTLKNEWQKAPRGSELFLAAGKIRVVDRMMYSPRDYIPSRYYAKYLLEASQGDVIIQGTNKAMMRVEPTKEGKFKVIWRDDRFIETSAVVLTKNAVVVAGRIAGKNKGEMRDVLMALNPKDGKPMWSNDLPARAESWGLAIDSQGRIIVTLVNGRVLCYAK